MGATNVSFDFTGQVVIVTGAGKGIGRRTALAFAAAGASVALAGRHADTLDATAAEAAKFGRPTLAVPTDVQSVAAIEALVERTVTTLGPPDVLVNNAGIFPRSAFLEMTEREWDHVLSVNLKGGFLCAQAVARTLVAAGRPGAIVNIASSAVRGDPRGVHYSASKAGVVGMTRAMALALAPHRIRVNAIAPGLTDTMQPRYGNTEEQIAERAREIPLGRMAQPEEIARVAVFLATSDAEWITGELIHVNGGAYMA